MIYFTDEGLSMPLLQDEVFSTQTEENLVMVRKLVGGYICKKLNLKASRTNPSEWVAMKGEGRLLEPCSEVMDTVEKADQLFTQFNGKKISLRKTSDPIGKVIKYILKEQPNLNPKVVKLYCRVKFFARLKLMNKALRSSKGRCVRYLKQTAQFLY